MWSYILRDFADIIMLTILIWGNFLDERAQCSQLRRPLYEGAQKEHTQRTKYIVTLSGKEIQGM